MDKEYKKEKKSPCVHNPVADCVRTQNICEESDPRSGTEALGANEHPLYANFTGDCTSDEVSDSTATKEMPPS